MNRRHLFPAKTRPYLAKGGAHWGLRVAACGVAILLITSAVIQYRWNLQIRQAAEIGLGTRLESLMVKWHLNLYRELSTICIALQVGPDSGAHNSSTDYLLRFEEWRRAAGGTDTENIYSNPDVVSDIYIYQTSSSVSHLLRLNPDANRIDPSGVPSELEAFLGYLEKRSGTLQMALHAWDPDWSKQVVEAEVGLTELPAKPTTGWQFEESIPAIVHPIVHHGDQRHNRRPQVDWLIVVLNRNAITHRILPEIATRYFVGAHGPDFRLAVAAVGKTSQLLYSSEPGFGLRDLNESESVMTVFGPPPESTEGSFWQVIKSRESLHGDEWRSFPGPVWFPVFRRVDDPHEWVLFLKQRSGSVKGTIAKVWHANLFIGSMTLLLLAASIFLVIIAAQRVRTLAAMRMDFVASVSHELRTPLAAILASGQNLSDGFASDQSYYGALITRQARQLVELVDQVLLFASIRDGKKRYSLSAVTVNEVFESLRESILMILGNDGFCVECRLANNLPPVLGNRQALTRCLQNLIENAAKYSGDSRWIGVSAEIDEISHKERRIKIVVADRGLGIAESELPNVFEPFYRSPDAIAAQIHGSGLGLSVAMQIVKEMRGSLSVTSEVGKGSIFTLSLKAA